MLSTLDVEKLIAEKKLQIEKEKALLNLVSSNSSCEVQNVKQESTNKENLHKQVNFASNKAKAVSHDVSDSEEKKDHQQTVQDSEESIPPDLDRYIRRYLGLPVMLKAGEYSPNNPLVRGERSSGDVLLGLGEYERRRHTLRRVRQQQYREYLDQQAKKKQEAKEQADRERREREEREREQEERERAREEREREQREREQREREQREREQREREQRERERRLLEQERRSPERRRTSVSYSNNYSYSNKVDTGVQVSCVTTPLSVAVQTDDIDFYQLSSSKCQLTQAERELSPHTVAGGDERPIKPAPWAAPGGSSGDQLESSPVLKKPSQKLQSMYMPSIFDADAIQLRNIQVEKEAAARRLYYQQELKNQIMEQQRIREERKAREKMLEQAEMRRLEEQLRMLRAAQEQEKGRQKEIDVAMKNDAEEYDMKRTELHKEIEYEEQKLLRAPLLHQALPKRTETARSEGSKLPFYYPSIPERNTTYEYTNHENSYNTNLQPDTMFSSNYDVDTYLRKNLNFNKGFDIENIGVEKERSLERVDHDRTKPKFREKTPKESEDSLPIPVLRHSPLIQSDKVDCDLSDAMKKVEDKWKVPVVQKNILKSVPNDEGKKVNILTQLGSIRRQLQLEQLKLDQMSKSDE